MIGAGLGGLAVSAMLAAEGYEITVFERNSGFGGKMNEEEAEGYRFDTGPSLFTMPEVLEEVFRHCGEDMYDQLTLSELDPLCRYFYPDGTVFNSYSDREKDLEEIRRIAPEDLEPYKQFLSYSKDLYDKTSGAFLFNPLYSLHDLKDLNLFSFFGIDAFNTVAGRVDKTFKTQYLRKFFKRFTTYNGSSPYKAPATLNVIPHVEVNQGGYYVKGGLYEVARALKELAERNGATFRFNAPVSSINTRYRKVTGITLADGEQVNSDLVISNSDSTETLVHMLPDEVIDKKTKEKTESIEPSCSGFVLLLGVKKIYEHLAHHNIFFSDDYEQEFHQIFEQKVMPDDPTIYVANTSYSDPDHAPEGSSNFFVLVNAPYLSPEYNWELEAESYADKVIGELESRGLDGLRQHIDYQDMITPVDFYTKYRSNRGSIYGTSSNDKFSAFLRPRNKYKDLEGLYLTGGSTHPGGGIPLVMQSAHNVIKLIKRYEAV